MSRGRRTEPEQIYEIMATWAITDSYSETARALDVPRKTVEKIVKEHKDKPEFAKLCYEKRTEFSEKANDIINKALERLEKLISDNSIDIPVNHLVTVIGVLFDKRALAIGNATQNTVVEVKLPKETEEYAG